MTILYRLINYRLCCCPIPCAMCAWLWLARASLESFPSVSFTAQGPPKFLYPNWAWEKQMGEDVREGWRDGWFGSKRDLSAVSCTSSAPCFFSRCTVLYSNVTRHPLDPLTSNTYASQSPSGSHGTTSDKPIIPHADMATQRKGKGGHVALSCALA